MEFVDDDEVLLPPEYFTKSYHAVFDKLNNEQRELVRTACELFKTASMAYRSANDKYANETKRIQHAGSDARCFIKQLVYFKSLLNGTEFTNVKLDKIEAYLVKCGWRGLPVYYDINDSKVIVASAKAMIIDMFNFKNKAKQLSEAIEDEKDESTTTKNKKGADHDKASTSKTEE